MDRRCLSEQLGRALALRPTHGDRQLPRTHTRQGIDQPLDPPRLPLIAAYRRSGTLGLVSVVPPSDVLRAATGSTALEHVSEHVIRGSTGAATGVVTRLSGAVTVQGESLPFSLIRKTVRPVASGRHAEASKDPRHWAY